MKKNLFVGLLIAFVVSLAATAYAMGIECPRCGLDNCTWTGEIQTDAWGMYHEYRCIHGHRFWVKI